MVVKTGGCVGEWIGHGKLEEVARKGTAEFWGAGNGGWGGALWQ